MIFKLTSIWHQLKRRMLLDDIYSICVFICRRTPKAWACSRVIGGLVVDQAAYASTGNVHDMPMIDDPGVMLSSRSYSFELYP